MKKIFLILIANFCLGANLMQYDLFNHDDSVDIVLAFDSAYKPDIVRSVDGQSMSLILKGLGGDEKFNEMRTNQKVLKSFTIAPKGKDIEINFPTGANLLVDALTQDGNLKLVLRVKNPAFDQSRMSVKSEGGEAASGKSSSLGWIMPLLVAILFIVAAVVFVRKVLARKSYKSIDETWRVFDDDAEQAHDLGEAENSKNSNGADLWDEENGAKFAGESSKSAYDDFYDEISQTEIKEEDSKFKNELSDNSSDEISQNSFDAEDEDLNFKEPSSERETLSDESGAFGDEISRDTDQNGAADTGVKKAEMQGFSSELKEKLGVKEAGTLTFKKVLQDEILSAPALPSSDVEVDFVGSIDEENTAVVLSFGGKKHLVVLKDSNVID